jgi:hypothetical protein
MRRPYKHWQCGAELEGARHYLAELAILINCRYRAPVRPGSELFASAIKKVVCTVHQPADVQVDNLCKRRR